MTQFTTFLIGPYHYAIDVKRVQEVTHKMPITKVPLAPDCIKGLINLRGQIATAVGLNELFDLKLNNREDQQMTVVCKVDGNLLSLLVDSIGEVIELDEKNFEPTPDSIKGNIKKFMTGVFKTQEQILSVIDLDKVNVELNKVLEK